MSRQIKVSLPDDLLQLVDEVGQQTAQSASAVIRTAVAHYFGRQVQEAGTLRWNGRKVPRVINVVVNGEDNH